MPCRHASFAIPGKTDADAADSSRYDWGAEAAVAVDVHVDEDEQDNCAGRPFRSSWRCLCPRADWRTNQQRSDATGAPVWIQWAADGAISLLLHAYDLSETSACSCIFAGYQSLFGGKKLTADDDLGDALVVFEWTVVRGGAVTPRRFSMRSLRAPQTTIATRPSLAIARRVL